MYYIFYKANVNKPIEMRKKYLSTEIQDLQNL